MHCVENFIPIICNCTKNRKKPEDFNLLVSGFFSPCSKHQTWELCLWVPQAQIVSTGGFLNIAWFKGGFFSGTNQIFSQVLQSHQKSASMKLCTLFYIKLKRALEERQPQLVSHIYTTSVRQLQWGSQREAASVRCSVRLIQWDSHSDTNYVRQLQWGSLNEAVTFNHPQWGIISKQPQWGSQN